MMREIALFLSEKPWSTAEQIGKSLGFATDYVAEYINGVMIRDGCATGECAFWQEDGNEKFHCSKRRYLITNLKYALNYSE